MVQKPRRARKRKFEFAKEVKEVGRVGPSRKIKYHISGMGSKFHVLSDVSAVVGKDNELEIHPSSIVTDTICNSEDVLVVEKLDVNQVNGGKRKMRRDLLKEQKKNKLLSTVVARGIQKGNSKGAAKSKGVQEIDDLLSVDEASDLVTNLKLKDEDGAQRNRRNNLD